METIIEENIDRKNIITMKLLHYFITEKNYNPIILQGVDNEIWLENLSQDYKIIRIVSNYIHNNEQFDFDVFKTKKIVKKIKRKTMSFKMNVLSIFTDLGDNVDLDKEKYVDCLSINDEKDLKKYKQIKTVFPDMFKKLIYNEDGVQLFMKITNDINNHNKEDQAKAEEIFKQKKPKITYALIIINVLLFLIPKLLGNYEEIIERFCLYGPSIRINQEYYRLLTGAFLHGGIFHLLFNCYALFIIGSQLEGFLGKTRYIIIYLFSAVAGGLLSISFGSYASIGASGAVFGLMGSLLYFGYHYRVYLGNVVKSQIIPLIIMNLFLGFMMKGIDNAAHIGGLIGGILMTISLGVKYKSTKFEQINGIIVTGIFTILMIYISMFYIK